MKLELTTQQAKDLEEDLNHLTHRYEARPDSADINVCEFCGIQSPLGQPIEHEEFCIGMVLLRKLQKAKEEPKFSTPANPPIRCASCQGMEFTRYGERCYVCHGCKKTWVR